MGQSSSTATEHARRVRSLQKGGVVEIIEVIRDLDPDDGPSPKGGLSWEQLPELLAAPGRRSREAARLAEWVTLGVRARLEPADVLRVAYLESIGIAPPDWATGG